MACFFQLLVSSYQSHRSKIQHLFKDLSTSKTIPLELKNSTHKTIFDYYQCCIGRYTRAVYLYISTAMMYDDDETVLSLLKKHAKENLHVGVMRRGSNLHKHFVQTMPTFC